MNDEASRPTELSVEQLTSLMSESDVKRAAWLFGRLIEEEDELVRANLLKPYEDRVPQVLRVLPPARAAALLDLLPIGKVKRALFGNYTRIPDDRLRAIIAAMAPEQGARLLEAMSIGVDAPREMARVLAGLPQAALVPLSQTLHPAAVIRLLTELEPQEQQQVYVRLGETAAVAVLEALLAEENLVYAAWAAHLLQALEPSARAAIEARLGENLREMLARGSACGMVDPLPTQALREVRLFLEEAPPETAVTVLREMHPSRAVQTLRTIPAARGAALLQDLAAQDPDLAADLLEAMNSRILLRPPRADTAPAWWLGDCPAAAILEAMDLTQPASQALLRALRPEQLELILQHLSPQRQADINGILETAQSGHLPFSLDVLAVGRGRRKSRRVDGGFRWVHIEEQLDVGARVKPVIIDLLEIELEQVRLEAWMAVDEKTAMPVSQAAEVFEEYRRTGRRPGGSAFAHMGLVQLSRAVEAAGAMAAINGNFYFDYGHYINGITLGIDMAQVPGLFFGDPIGWFVSNGTELIPPAFNRAAGVATSQGGFYIDRVFMTDITLPSGRRLRWDDLNRPKAPGRVIAYNSLFGYRTERADTHVDLAIARGHIWA
ncbi:MAG: hypothetical protein D6775_12275, partial [Caldilineae bacterium]